MKNLIDKIKNSTAAVQFIKFCIVGVSNTVVDYAVYAVSQLFCDYHIAQVIAFLLSVLWAFYWNNRFTFTGERTRKEMLLALLKSYVSYSFTGLILSEALLSLFVEYFGLSELLSKLLIIPIATPINFVLNKFWAFRNKKTEKAESPETPDT